MAQKNRSEEVGDLFVSETSVTVKLLPSRKSGTRTIRWFAGGTVKNVNSAARDIRALVGKIKGKKLVVKGLTVMTDKGVTHDIVKSGLVDAVEQAGFTVIR